MSSMFAFTEEEQKAALENYENIGMSTRRDSRICRCGHRRSAHSAESNTAYHKAMVVMGTPVCIVGKQQCPCPRFDPVISTSDVRHFMSKTRSSGPLHALSLGVSLALKNGAEVSWLPGVVCDKCKSDDGRSIVPIVVNESWHEIDRPSPYNLLLCTECRVDLASRV